MLPFDKLEFETKMKEKFGMGIKDEAKWMEFEGVPVKFQYV